MIGSDTVPNWLPNWTEYLYRYGARIATESEPNSRLTYIDRPSRFRIGTDSADRIGWPIRLNRVPHRPSDRRADFFENRNGNVHREVVLKEKSLLKI